jgi:hypothetical protein
MKKVLFIDARKGGDFTLDAVWAGLVDRHGWENVVDWPPSEKHREGIPSITGDVEKDYGAERRSLCYTPHHKEFRHHTLWDVNELMRHGEIERIFIDERQESYELYIRTIARSIDVPVVVIAGHDRFWNIAPDNPTWILRQYYGKNLQGVFLDNWRPSYGGPGVFPMSYATNFDHLWDVSKREALLANKVYDICFMGYNSHGDRARIVDHLLQKYGYDNNCIFVETRANVMDAFLPKREYFQKMAQARICVNLRGGAECGKALRFYEIPYVGSYMLSQRFEGKQVYPYEDGKHCNYFGSLTELDEFIHLALSDTPIREKIARAGHEHAMKYHTARARVDYIYRCLDGQS